MHNRSRYIVITRPDFWLGEADAITLLFQAGMERLHLRKPGATEHEIESLMAQIPACYHERIVVGKITTATTCSCHNIAELAEQKRNPQYEYLTLSPIYDSISKEGYKAAFSEEELMAARTAGIIDERVMAMGGISRDNVETVLRYGFGGVLVLGDAWHMQELPIVLSIAGSDPSAGAGIQQDLKTITHHNCYGATVITSLTTQNTMGVQSQMPVPAEVVESQLTAVLEDLRVDAIKIGIIPNIEVARVIVRVINKVKRRCIMPVVYDQVMVSSSGHVLMDEACRQYVAEELFPLCTLITPNIPETNELGWDNQNPPYNVLFKGGHAEGNMMTDRLWLTDEQREVVLNSPRIETNNLHGTGCTLSSAIACGLARQQSLVSSVSQAKDYINRAIIGGRDLHIGHGNGPLWGGINTIG